MLINSFIILTKNKYSKKRSPPKKKHAKQHPISKRIQNPLPKKKPNNRNKQQLPLHNKQKRFKNTPNNFKKRQSIRSKQNRL